MALPSETRARMRLTLEGLLGKAGDVVDETVAIEAALDDLEGAVLHPRKPTRRHLPDERLSGTATLTVAAGADDELEWQVTLGYYDDGDLGEMFVRQEREGGTVAALLDAVATVSSIALQHGIPWETIAAKLAHQRFPPHGLTLDEDPTLKMVSSPLDYLARWISKRTTFNPGLWRKRA
jgi:hypothetical protein